MFFLVLTEQDVSPDSIARLDDLKGGIALQSRLL